MNRFRECREKTVYSQKQVAMMIGVKPPQLSKWENGTGNPSRENCIKLAKLYNVSADYLLGLTDEPTEQDNDVWLLREKLRRDPAYRMLFDASKNASPEHIRAAAAMLKALEGERDD